jgi:hypothetical protein
MNFALAILLLLGQEVPTLEDHVRFLTSDECAGRETGTDGEKKAAAYLEKELKRWKIETSVPEFRGHGTVGRNVIGIVKGTEGDEAVVVGAHYDHLGESEKGICRGADDNASGTAVVLEVARRLAARPAKRTVVVAFFSGEEMGVLGSRAYVAKPLVPLEKTVAMVNLDMVGRLGSKLIVFGVESGDRFQEYLDESPLRIVSKGDPIGPSDHTSFYLKGVPAVHVFTGSHKDWHKPTDTPDKLNIEGMRLVAYEVERLARRIADAPERMAFKKVESAAPLPAGPRAGGTPYLGLMPDYGFEGKGVRLAGVAPGSPAEKSGLKEGDVITKVDGKDCEEVKAYSALFFSKRPGQEMTLDYLRDGKPATLKVVLGVKRTSDE